MIVETENLKKRFDGVIALEDVNLEFLPGSVTAIIGPNGAGKTTLLNVMAGFIQPDSGSVFLIEGNDNPFVSGAGTEKNNVKRDIVGLAPYMVASLGVGVLFQDVRVFKRLSLLENVITGMKHQIGENPLAPFFQFHAVERQEREAIEKAAHLLEIVGLSEKSRLCAEQLSFGEQKLLAICRLLAGESKVLLLDEPTSGVHPEMVARLLDVIQTIAEKDACTIIIVEHNLKVVKRVGSWVYLMAGGKVEVFGKPQEVLRDETLRTLFPTL
jgi:ABC-type branched-subunit amino acid transport system ATPase component